MLGRCPGQHALGSSAFINARTRPCARSFPLPSPPPSSVNAWRFSGVSGRSPLPLCTQRRYRGEPLAWDMEHSITNPAV
jgi:hypothetical protein